MLLDPLHVTGDLAGLLADYLRQQGLADAPLTRRLQAFPSNSRMTFRDWWQLLEDVQTLLPEQPVGLELGMSFQPSHLGVLGYLTLSCSNVAEALQRFERYQRLLHEGDRAQTLLQPDRVILRWSTDYGPSTQLSDEVLVVGLLRFLRMMTGRDDLIPLQVNFKLSPPQDLAPHQALFRCPLGFNQPHTELHFPLDYFALPVTNSDPGLKNLLDRQAQALLDVLPQEEAFTQALQDAIVRAIQGGEPALETVARDLALSPRTLHRRLAERQLVFKDLLQQTRLQLARQYLRERRLTLAEVALLLGYSEQSAFSRAFRQWTGQTPLQYQKQLMHK